MEINRKADPAEFPWTCEEFARHNGVKPESVRSRLCRYESYFGVTPLRLKNGRLMFPAVQVA